MEDRQTKNAFLDFFIYLALYLAVSFFPWTRWLSQNVGLLFSFSAKFIYGFFLLKKLSSTKGLSFSYDKKKIAWISPLFLICLSNIFFFFITKQSLAKNQNYLYLLNDFALQFVIVVCEELIFREIGLNTFQMRFSKEISILLISLIFAASHILAGVFVNPIAALIQGAYTFGLSILLGFIYLYGGSLPWTILFHVAFNFLNDSLFTKIYAGEWTTAFYIVNLSFALFGVIYTSFLYFFFKRKTTSK